MIWRAAPQPGVDRMVSTGWGAGRRSSPAARQGRASARGLEGRPAPQHHHASDRNSQKLCRKPLCLLTPITVSVRAEGRGADRLHGDQPHDQPRHAGLPEGRLSTSTEGEIVPNAIYAPKPQGTAFPTTPAKTAGTGSDTRAGSNRATGPPPATGGDTAPESNPTG